MSDGSLISLIISLVSTLITVIMLGLTRQDMNRREKKDQEMFVSGVYENFQQLQLAFTQDTGALKLMAEDRKQSPEEIKRGSISALWVNQALSIFQLYERGYIEKELWARFSVDMKLLFSRPSVNRWWQKMKIHYPQSFQTYINESILNFSTSKQFNTKTMKLKAIHHTANCDSSSCPTIYLNEKGNYVFQGFKIEKSVKNQLKVPQNEDMIEVPKEFLQAFMQKQEI